MCYLHHGLKFWLITLRNKQCRYGLRPQPSNQSVNKLYVEIVQHSATLHSRKNTSVHSRHFLHTGCMVWAVTSPKNYETSVFKTYKLVRPEKKTI